MVRHGRATRGRVIEVSILSGKLASRAMRARATPTSRWSLAYVKLLPQPGEDDTAERLNDYLSRAGPARP
jgi:hypothetical protein